MSAGTMSQVLTSFKPFCIATSEELFLAAAAPAAGFASVHPNQLWVLAISGTTFTAALGSVVAMIRLTLHFTKEDIKSLKAPSDRKLQTSMPNAAAGATVSTSS